MALNCHISTTSLARLLACLIPVVCLIAAGIAGDSRAAIIETARSHLGARYRYGGSGAGGFDCSGFVQFVYGRHGIALPRTAGEQFRAGTAIPVGEALPGDLLFWATYRADVSHVGIYLGNGTFIHAPVPGRQVSIADMNLEYWRSRFRGAVTFFPVQKNDKGDEHDDKKNKTGEKAGSKSASQSRG